jgi:hypothetical protein
MISVGAADTRGANLLRFRELDLNVTVETLLLEWHEVFIFKLTFGDLHAQVDKWVESFGIGHFGSSICFKIC